MVSPTYYVTQFKSQFVIANLLNIRRKVAASLKSARFCFFEAHEGKNLSDAIGSLAKQAISRETMTTLEGFAEGSMLTVAEEIKSRLLAGLNFNEDGKVGNFSFFK